MGGIEVLFGVLLLLMERSSAGWNKMELHRMDEKSVEWLSQDCFSMDFYRSFEWGSPHLFGGTYRVPMRDRSWSSLAKPTWKNTQIRKRDRQGNSELIAFKNPRDRAKQGKCVDLDELGCDTLLNLTSMLPRYSTLYYHEVVEQMVPNYGVVHETLKDRSDRQVCITMRDHYDQGGRWIERIFLDALMHFRSISEDYKFGKAFKFVNDSRNCFTTSRGDVSYYAPKEIRSTSRKEMVQKSLALCNDLSHLRTTCRVAEEVTVFGNPSGKLVNLLLLQREEGISRSFLDVKKVKTLLLGLAAKPGMGAFKFALRFHMPKHTYSEQLCLYGATDVFLHWHGAGGANALFMNLNAVVVEMSVFHQESVPQASDNSSVSEPLRSMGKKERSFYDLYFWRSNVHPTVDFRPDLRWYVVAFRDSAVLIQKERDIKGWVNDHWKWPLEQFIKNIDRQGHSWSQRVKEAVVDLGEEEGSRLLDVIGGAIKQREVKMSRPTSISTPRPLLPSSLVN